MIIKQNIRKQSFDTKNTGNLVQKFDVESILNCSVSDVYTDNDFLVAVGYFEKNVGDGSALMFTNMSNIYCTDESPAPVFFKVKNVDTYWNIWFAPLKPQGKSKGGPDYCSYNMSKSLFIYRYVKLGDIFVSSPITINDLCIYVQCILGKIIAEYHSGKIFDVLK